jgi:Spy/CpxP family protein refolding chaperone
MRRQTNYTEWSSDVDETDRTARENLRDFETENPFDDPEVRQRIAELIARSARIDKKSRF